MSAPKRAEDSELVWFQQGLRFTCSQCGACCSGDPGVVWVTDQEIRRLADFLEISVSAFAKRYLRRVRTRLSLKEKANGDCVLLERPGMTCSVYPVRPTQCRTFPFWPELIRSEEAWEEAGEYCPGIGVGRLWPEEFCTERAEQTRRATRRTARKVPGTAAPKGPGRTA